MENDEFLDNLCFQILSKKNIDDEEHIARLKEELDVIKYGGLSDFFLTTSYMLEYLRANDVFIGPGRGSAGGSLVCYLLNITAVDPIGKGLLFSRFLNQTRVKGLLPDIDVDIAQKDRPKALKLIKEKFGENKTFQVLNKVYYTPKTTIKDLARIFEINFQEANRATGTIADDDNYLTSEVKALFNKYPVLEENFDKLNGLLKNYSIHAGASILLPDDVYNYTGTLKIGDTFVLDNDGRTCEGDFKFLKQDTLGLKTLTEIKDCIEIIGEDIELPLINLEDPKVYDTINKSSLSIFQFSAGGGRQYIQKLKPTCFDDLSAASALLRPGAQDSGDADRYIERKYGREEVEYDHPLLEPILKDTFGCIVYQEQAMQIAISLAGFTEVESNQLRKGIGKKLDYIFEEYKPKFISGCVNNGVTEQIAHLIWDKIEASSSYSFNKSHSYFYSIISYWCAWLKTYYPVEWLLALLQNEKDENERNKLYAELRSISKINNPHINYSKEYLTELNGEIYLSLPLIKGVGDKAVKAIVEQQPYMSFDDFMNRKDSRRVNKKVVKALIYAGAFDCFTPDRESLLNIIKGKKEDDIVLSEEERLFQEFSMLKINPKKNLLDLYDLSDLKIELTPLSDIETTMDEVKGIYIKCIVSDIDIRKEYSFTSLTDGFTSISAFTPLHITEKYFDELKSTGLPILAKINVKDGRATIVELLSLKDKDNDKYQRLLWTMNGEIDNKLESLQEANPQINVGYALNTSHFISKKGNKCCKLDISLGNEQIIEDRLVVGDFADISEGDFLFFYVNHEVFLNIIQVA